MLKNTAIYNIIKYNIILSLLNFFFFAVVDHKKTSVFLQHVVFRSSYFSTKPWNIYPQSTLALRAEVEASGAGDLT